MLRLAIAGIGVIARKYIRLICQGQVPGVQLCALCSRSAESLHAVVDEHPELKAVPAFTSYDELLAAHLADAVLITTPHGQHPAMALKAVNAGYHVLTEKPVGIHTEDVQKVLDALEGKPSLVVGVMYNRRRSPAYQKIHDLIADGFLGVPVRVSWILTNLYRPDCYYASATWRGTWAGEGGGVLINQASHQLDILQWLFGMPQSMLARWRTVDRAIEVENEAELLMDFPGGARGQFIVSAYEAPGTNRLELCGTKGRIVLTDDRELELTTLAQDARDFSRSCTLLFGAPGYTTEHSTFPAMEDGEQQAAMMRNFAAAVSGKEAVACTLSDGLNSLRMIRAAYESQRLGKTVSI